MCKYCDKPSGNEYRVEILSATSISYNKTYIEHRRVPVQGEFLPCFKYCLVVEHSYMDNSSKTVTPIDFCPYCGRQLEGNKGK